MNKKIAKIGLLTLLAFGGISITTHAVTTANIEIIQSEQKTETFKVYGNCGMCKRTIEGSLINVNGVSKASWDKETKMMKVTFDESIITLKEIKQKIADVGYDSDELSASSEAYNKLAGCCQYERPTEEMHNHKH